MPHTLSLLLLLTLLALLATPASPAPAQSLPQSQPSIPSPLTLSDWQLQDLAKVKEPAESLSQPTFKPADWYKATVPGTVLTTLVNCGIYPEPLYGENNRSIPESLCRTSYWYRTQFTIPPDYANKHIWLNFEGINYTAEVWLNGKNLGNIRGAFTRGIFDITPYVSAGGQATLAVLIQPPPHPGNPREQTLAAGTGPNGGPMSSDGPTFLCSQGWDWIPAIRDRNMGIWQKVTLSATGPVTIQDPTITSDFPPASPPNTPSASPFNYADLTVQTTLKNASDTPQSGLLHVQIDAITLQIPITLQPKEARLVTLSPSTHPQLHLPNPRLWWPNGCGDPNLYTLHLSFEQALTSASSDTKEISFGIRKITYEVPDSPNLTLCVNGQKIFVKGGNWGMDEAMKRIPRDRLEAQIRMHKLANYNMIRNWVGQSTGEDFYDLCDRYGILVWDEFFQPNASDGPRPLNPDVDLYLANVREKVLRFRSHPCIALWCGRNESNPEPAAIAKGLADITSTLDPTRLYHANSADGRGVRSGGPYAWRNPRQFYQFPATEAFKTELGSVSIPTLEAIQNMMPKKDWETINDDWAQHDLCNGAQQGGQYPITLAQRYGSIPNLADFVRKAQLANYEAYRAMYEGRLARMFSPATGVLTWMSNPAQPSMVWQLYSHDLEPNASLFATRVACEPVHIQMNQSDFRLMVINNTPVALAGYKAVTRIYRLDGTMAAERMATVSAKPAAATDLGAIAFPADLSGVHFVGLELRDSQDRVVSRNFYWRDAGSGTELFTALQTMATVVLEVKAERRAGEGEDVGKVFVEVALRNPGPGVALLAHVQLRNKESGERLLPVYYSENYVSLVAGESRTILVEVGAKLLGVGVPLVVVDGFNVTVKEGEFGEGRGLVVVGPNAGALVGPVAATGPGGG